jgi:hypothetical protein
MPWLEGRDWSLALKKRNDASASLIAPAFRPAAFDAAG